MFKIGFLEEKIDELMQKNAEIENQHYTDIMTSLRSFKEEVETKDDLDDESWYEAAEEIVKEQGVGSATLLQRKLRIGYAKAARILDMLEENGIIEPADGMNPRKYIGPGSEGDIEE
jgi:S-DNA-T family DNA segregation ATPase FtsK/SpoIIIE